MERDMSMHLVGPYMTTTQYNRKKKQSKSKKLQQAQAEHEKWLKKMGVSKHTGDFRYAMPDYTSNSGNSDPTSDKIVGPTKKKVYPQLDLPEGKCVTIAYNKGGYQLVDKEDL